MGQFRGINGFGSGFRGGLESGFYDINGMPPHLIDEMQSPGTCYAWLEGAQGGGMCLVPTSPQSMPGTEGQCPLPPEGPGYPKVAAYNSPTTASRRLADKFSDISRQTTAVYATNEQGQSTTQMNGFIHVIGGTRDNADITEIPADVTLVPQWYANAQNGGGEIGGVAKAWKNKADKLRAGDAKLAGNLDENIDLYEQGRDNELTGNYLPGTSVITQTTADNRGDMPEYFINMATVPHPSIRKTGEASQNDRMRYVKGIIREMLIQLLHLEKEGKIKPNLAKPVVVSLPVISTGPDGAVSYDEAGACLIKTLGAFLQKHPGYEFIIPTHAQGIDGEDKGAALEKFNKIMRGDAATLKSLKVPEMTTPRRIFDQLIDGYRIPAASGKGVKVDDAYLNKKFAAWKKSVVAEISGASDDDLNSIKKAVALFPHRGTQNFIADMIKNLRLEKEMENETGEMPRLTKAEIIAAINDDTLKEAIFDFLVIEVMVPLNIKDAFGGDRKMAEIMGAAASVVMHRRSYQKLLEVMDAQKDRIHAIQESLSDSERQHRQQEQEYQRKLEEAKKEREKLLETSEMAALNEQTLNTIIEGLKQTAEAASEQAQQQIQSFSTQTQNALRDLAKKQQELDQKNQEIRRLEADKRNLESSLNSARTSSSRVSSSSSFGGG